MLQNRLFFYLGFFIVMATISDNLVGDFHIQVKDPLVPFSSILHLLINSDLVEILILGQSMAL
jgi:hypothetical protein